MIIYALYWGINKKYIYQVVLFTFRWQEFGKDMYFFFTVCDSYDVHKVNDKHICLVDLIGIACYINHTSYTLYVNM